MGRGEGEKPANGHQRAHPDEIGPKLPPSRFGFVGDRPHNRIVDGVPNPGYEEHGPHGCRRQPEYIRIEKRKKKHERLEKQIGGGISEAVAYLFPYRQLCRRYGRSVGSTLGIFHISPDFRTCRWRMSGSFPAILKALNGGFSSPFNSQQICENASFGIFEFAGSDCTTGLRK